MSALNSAIVIARLLGTEGFTDHTANEVERYFRNRSGLNDRQKKAISLLDKEVSNIMRHLTKGECLVIGKFIGLHKKMSFDTGLKIGLQAFATKEAKSVELDEL